jgi:dolichol-phosphate mannosyltransferase
MRDVNVVSVFLVAGIPSLLFGAAWSSYHWIHSIRYDVFTSTGTVMIGVLAIVLGFQLILQAIVLDVGNEPPAGRSRAG